MQKPPMISSVHIQGERAYKRARRGELFDIPKREVTIYNIILLEWSLENGTIKISIDCSSGTYIRSLARDIGNKLNCGGYLKSLRRTKALGFTEIEAIQIPSCQEGKMLKSIPRLLNPLSALKHMPSIVLKSDNALISWRHGRELINNEEILYKKASIDFEDADSKTNIDLVVVIDDLGQIIGIAKKNKSLNYQPKVVFNAYN